MCSQAVCRGACCPRKWLWFGHELLAQTARLAIPRRLAARTRSAVEEVARSRPAGLLARHRGQLFGACCARGKKTGPNPTDLRKAGSKHHIITEAHGVPLKAIVTAANDHDVTQLLPLVSGIPPIAGKPGRPRLARSAKAIAPTTRSRIGGPWPGAAFVVCWPAAIRHMAAVWARRAGWLNAHWPGVNFQKKCASRDSRSEEVYCSLILPLRMTSAYLAISRLTWAPSWSGELATGSSPSVTMKS